jgi:hypothetical protein
VNLIQNRISLLKDKILKEKDMVANFEIFDIARLAEPLPHVYVDARTKGGDLYKTTTLTTQKKRFEEIYNENQRINQNCTILSTWTRLPLQA